MNTLMQHEFPKAKASKLAGISRSILYYNKRSREHRFDPDLEKKMRYLIEERPSYGSRRVTAMLHMHGLVIGRNKVRRHMRHLNLIHTRKKGYRKKVPRILVVSRPNLMWETYITKVYIDHEGWIYFTAYVDLCSGKIKGYLVSRMSRTREMIEAFDNAILNTFPDLNVNGLIIRSDNGSQLTSQGYEKHLRMLGIKHETIHAHTPEEDGHIESYFGRFREDYIYTRDFISYDEFQRYIDLAVKDYNTIRPHSSLNYLTPEEFESAIMNEDFRNEWIEKQMNMKKHVKSFK